MAGLFTGIVGDLIGAGIQAAFGGIPIREDASEAIDVLRRGGLPVPPANWFTRKPSVEPRMEQGSGSIEEHVTGVMQILGPCAKIAKALSDFAYSESQPTATKDSKPSSTKSASIPIKKKREPKESLCLESIKRAEKKKTTKKNEKMLERILLSNYFPNDEEETENIRPTASTKVRGNSLVKNKMLSTNNGDEVETVLRKRDVKVDKLMNTAVISKGSKRGASTAVTKQSQKLVIKPQTKIGKSAHRDECQMCQAQIKNLKKLPLMPCGHLLYCHECLQTVGIKPLKCSKCGMKFMKS